jgi:hypothetical protein
MMRKNNSLVFFLTIFGAILLVFLAGCSNKEKWETFSANKTGGGNGAFENNLPKDFQMPTDDVGKKLLREYGAVFVARGVTPPNTVIFKDEAAVSAFQTSLSKASIKIGNFTVELQTPALEALKEALADAKQSNLTITPRAADSASRNYQDTVKLWASRVNPGLAHWISQRRLQQSDADRIRTLSPFEQVSEILKLEDKGMYFSQDLSKSIIYSVAPPGTSQHLSLLALDVNEHENGKIRDILARHGWYQTVRSDLPHFTFLGVKEDELSNLGLKKISDGDRVVWIPKL